MATRASRQRFLLLQHRLWPATAALLGTVQVAYSLLGASSCERSRWCALPTRQRGSRILANAGRLSFDEDAHGLFWLGDQDDNGGSPQDTSEVLELPVAPVQDVFLPTSEVLLEVAEPAERAIYDSLLLSGGRFVVAALFSKERQQVAQYGALLYLEDFHELPAGKHLAEHRAVGRVRLRRPVQGATAAELGTSFMRMEVELLRDDGAELEQENPVDQLGDELRELARLQGLRGGARPGEASAEELTSAFAPAALTEQLTAVQGLWRTHSGVRIRIDLDEVKGLGRLLTSDDGQLLLRLGSKQFAGRCAEGETVAGSSPAQVLSWDDGDTWTRLAGPPPYRFSPSAPAGAVWRAARRWRELGAWRTEVRRGESRWRSAEAIATTLKSGGKEETAAAEWDAAAGRADAAAAEELWEEVLRPCQRLLQADDLRSRLAIFRELLRAEITKLRLALAVAPRESESSEPEEADGKS